MVTGIFPPRCPTGGIPKVPNNHFLKAEHLYLNFRFLNKEEGQELQQGKTV